MWLILAASPVEIKHLLHHPGTSQTRPSSGGKATTGRLAGRNVFVATTGIGNSRAQSRLRRILAEKNPEAVLFCGAGGRINPALDIGDLVIADEIIELRPEPGGPPPEPIATFPANRNLTRHIQARAAKMKISCNRIVGRILSVDRPIESAEEASLLWQRWGAECVEMEGAGVARICCRLNLPFTVVRAISDLSDRNASTVFGHNLDLIGGRLTALIETVTADRIPDLRE